MDPWKRLHNEFKALMEVEDRSVRERELRDRFHGHVMYGESGKFGSWTLAGSPTESLQARFELLATEAGIALSSPPGTSPLDYWLHRLFVDLREIKSQHLQIYETSDGEGGFIERLFEASVTYCIRLDRRWLENTAMCSEEPRFERKMAADLHAEVNAGPSESPQSEPNGGPLSDDKSAVMPAAELATATPDLDTDRLKMVNDFLAQCNRESDLGFKITKKHIWHVVAGHTHPRQFQYWQARSAKTTDEDNRNFRRILSMHPSEFIGLLKKKGILPQRF